MKSYEQHLKSVKSFGEDLPLHYKPIMRSSAAFPLIVRKGKLDSIYTYMGYWIRKRNISVITALLTVREKTGEKLIVKSQEIKSCKSFVFRGSELLTGIDIKSDFFGSVEIEFFSAVDMVFPYPAITFAFESLKGLTFVHTAGRIYNDLDDLEQNEEQQVPETGFDVFLGKEFDPFFTFVNGPFPIVSSNYMIEFLDTRGNTRKLQRTLKNIPKYGLGWIKIFENIKERSGLMGDKLTVKITHDLKGFFPRFIAGNAYKDFEDVSLTHSYYDTSRDTSHAAIYKNPNPTQFFDSVVAIPLDKSFDEIELAIYPIFAKAQNKLSFELYNEDGIFIKKLEHAIEVTNGKNNFKYIGLMKAFSDSIADIQRGMFRVIIDGNGKVPARMKFGLNFIKSKNNEGLPSNICFNAIVPNSKIVAKPGTFKWCALFDCDYQRIYLHNTSFLRQGCEPSFVKTEIYRTFDDQILEFSINIPRDGTVEVLENNHNEIRKFLNDDIGWISFQCTSPFVTGYYVIDKGNGVIGADHIY